MPALLVLKAESRDSFGNILEGSEITIRRGHSQSGELAQIFSDEDGTQELSNPFTANDGSFSVYVPPGRYRVEGTSSAGSGFRLYDLVYSSPKVNVGSFGVVVVPHGDPELSQADAIANAEALQEAIDTTAEDGRTLVFPEGVIWVAKYIIRKSNSIAQGSRRSGASVIKMHGSVHRNMPLCLSSTRGEPQSNIHWSDVTFDFNRFRWSRASEGAPNENRPVDNTDQADFYGAGNIISFTTEEREAVFGAPSGALTQSAFITSDHNPLDSGLRSTYTRIRGIDGYKHSIDVTAPSYMRGQEPTALGLPTGTATVYDPQPACGIDLYDVYAVGAGDDCITTHHCTDINFYNAFGDVSSGVRTGNTNIVEIDDGSRNLSMYGRTVAIGGTTGLEIKGHADTPAPWNIYIEDFTAINNCIGFEPRHLGHHRSGSATFNVIAVDQGANTFMFSGDMSEVFSDGDVFEISGSTGNDGLYGVQEIEYSEGDDETTVEIVTNPNFETITEDILLEIASSVADGEVTVSGAVFSQTAKDIRVGNLRVIALRRMSSDDDDRIVFYRSDTRYAAKIKGYDGVDIENFEVFEGDEVDIDSLDGLDYQWLPTDIGPGHQHIVRAWLNARNVKIGNFKIRGLRDARHGFYVTNTFGRGLDWRGLDINHIDSRDGPQTILRVTTPTTGIIVGTYNIIGDHLGESYTSYGIRLSGGDSDKTIGAGNVEGYSNPIAWDGRTWQEPPVGFSQYVASGQGFLTTGSQNTFGDYYSYLRIPEAGVDGYILLADLAEGSHNLIGEIHATRSSNVTTGNHSMRMSIMTSSGSEPERRSLMWDVQAHSSTSVPELVYITEGGKDWLAIKAPSNDFRPLSRTSAWFRGRAIRHDDLFRIVDAGAEGGAVAASEQPAENTGAGGDPVDPVWQFNGHDVITTATITTVVFPGPFNSESEAAAAGVPVGAAYRDLTGIVFWRTG